MKKRMTHVWSLNCQQPSSCSFMYRLVHLSHTHMGVTRYSISVVKSGCVILGYCSNLFRWFVSRHVIHFRYKSSLSCRFSLLLLSFFWPRLFYIFTISALLNSCSVKNWCRKNKTSIWNLSMSLDSSRLGNHHGVCFMPSLCHDKLSPCLSRVVDLSIVLYAAFLIHILRCASIQLSVTWLFCNGVGGLFRSAWPVSF